ncbi:MAG: hypothetical protein V3U02_11425, partial [Calditrichia bacterium]
MKPIKRMVILLLLLCLTGTTCSKKTAKILVNATMQSCTESIVFLTTWWSKITLQSAIEIDPIGGLVIVYWVNQDGIACYGTPGVNAKTGHMSFAAIPGEVYIAKNENQTMSSEEFKKYKTISFDASVYEGSGLHFAQFVNWYYRSRKDGQIFSDPLTQQYSIPVIISFDQGAFCFAPVYASGANECNSGSLSVPDPGTVPGSPAVSASNNQRAMPNSLTMSESERIDYCFLNLQSG